MNQGLRTKQFFQFGKQLFSISLFGLSIAIVLEAGSSNAKPVEKQLQAPYYPNVTVQPGKKNVTAPLARLDNWYFSPEAMQLEFTLSAGRTPRHFYLAQPARIVVDLPNTKLGYIPTQQNYSGAIQRVRISQLNADVTRIVLDLAPGNFIVPNQVKLQPASKKNPTRWVLRPSVTGYQNSVQPGHYPQLPSNIPQKPYNSPQSPINQQLPFFTLPPSANNLPPINPNQPQPFVSVPPLTPNNSSQLPSNLPPPIFSNQPGNFNSPSPIIKPNFPIPTVVNFPPNIPETKVIEFGQPIPTSTTR